MIFMGRNVYQTCEEIVKLLRDWGFKEEVSWEFLKKAITILAGSRDITIRRYARDLVELGFLERISEAKWKILKTGDEHEAKSKMPKLIQSTLRMLRRDASGLP